MTGSLDQPEEVVSCYVIGAKLSFYLLNSQHGAMEGQRLKAIVSDLAGRRTEIIVPLQYLVSQPAFILLAKKIGSGKGIAERDALIQHLSDIFAPQLVESAREFLNGFLGINDESLVRSVGIDSQCEPEIANEPSISSAEGLLPGPISSVRNVSFVGSEKSKNKRSICLRKLMVLVSALTVLGALGYLAYIYLGRLPGATAVAPSLTERSYQDRLLFFSAFLAIASIWKNAGI